MKIIKDMAEHNRPREKLWGKSNRKLVEIFEKKIQARLAEIWGEEESAKA